MKDAGKIHKMNGELYQYVATLAAGQHKTHFAFTAPDGTTDTIPENVSDYADPVVASFGLSTTITPSLTLSGTPITFTALYTSPSGKAPTLANVDIDGATYAMTAGWQQLAARRDVQLHDDACRWRPLHPISLQ